MIRFLILVCGAFLFSSLLNYNITIVLTWVATVDESDVVNR